MRLKTKGNIAIAQAIFYFAQKGYSIFIPLGDDGEEIDLIITRDGKFLQRVQCKYTANRKICRSPKSLHKVYTVGLIPTKKPKRYSSDSFDLLFITTPESSYLLDWKKLCSHKSHIPTSLCCGKRLSHYKVL